jgi:hypothetical protein
LSTVTFSGSGAGVAQAETKEETTKSLKELHKNFNIFYTTHRTKANIRIFTAGGRTFFIKQFFRSPFRR